MSGYSWLLMLCRHFLLLCLSCVIPVMAVADETEIFYQADTTAVNANVLFLMDASGSMDLELPGSGGKTRMAVMKETFREVMATAPDDLKIGLMHYANNELLPSYQWGDIKGVSFPVSYLDTEAAGVIGSYSAVDNLPDAAAGQPVRTFLADIVDSWQPAGSTPIVDSLYEAARYFRGEASVWGKYPPAYNWAAHPVTYSGTPVCENPQSQECRLEWDECNGSQTACEVKAVSTCCNWTSDGAGGEYCVNNDYSCATDISHCQHQVCDGGASGTVIYNSPVEYSCQANFLVLMSDGKPEYPYLIDRTSDGTGQYAKSAYPDYAHNNYLVPALNPSVDSSTILTAIPALIGTDCTDSPSSYKSGTCGPELTQFLATADQSDLTGTQTVDTFTVAFGVDDPDGTAYLASLATVENGAYTAASADELAQAFKDVLGEVEKKSYSFVAPSFSVSEDSLLSNGSDVYIPVFDSKRTPLWSGNLRKFSLSDDNRITGVGDSAALAANGEFADTAQDLWSTDAHGADVQSGGAADKIPLPEQRKLLTDTTGSSLVNITDSEQSITREMLSSGTRRTEYDLADNYNNKTGEAGADGWSNFGYYYDCDGVKHTLFGPRLSAAVNIAEVTTCPAQIDAAKRKTLLRFARGYGLTASGEIDTDPAAARKHMGDMLNTKPLVVSYENQSLVLVATNEGYLHAIDASSGVEQWAFMPSVLLKNQMMFLEDAEDGKHVYGLDGPLTLWNHDADKDGVIDEKGLEGDKRLLFFGMRRGGNMYYALDITDPSSPKIHWKISPETLSVGLSSDFARLGETWSKPTLSKMRVANDNGSGSDVKYVLVFGGGYDTEYDKQDAAARTHASSGVAALGADVYIVDAETGALIWSANEAGGNAASGLQHSVTGDIRVLDMDNNGELDRLYFADLGGNIWRADLSMRISSSGSDTRFENKTVLTKLAALGDVGTAGDHRKFFYEPDTALRMRGGETIMTIAIGSGYRTHPLNLGNDDNFYVLIDPDVFTTPASDTAAISQNDLEAANPDGSGIGGSILSLFPAKKGWYMPLQHYGEKSLSTSLTFLDKVLFTTFAQADVAGNPSVPAPCVPLTTTSRAYVLDLLTGAAVANLDRAKATRDTGESSKIKDPFAVTGIGEIPDSPQLIFSRLTDSDGGNCTEGNCQQSVSVRIGKLDMPLLDLENTENNANAGYSETVDLTKLLPRLYWRDKGFKIE